VEILAQRKKHPWQITITDYSAINRNSKDCQGQTICGIGGKGNERRRKERKIMERNKNERRHGKDKRK
jgi:hypothetical protein